MARKAQTELTLPDGRKVAANLQRRGNVLRVLFPDPVRKGKYREVSTGKVSQPDAWVEAAKIVTDAYNPSAKPNARTVTWEQALADLPTAADLRPRALEVYVSGVNILRNTLLAAEAARHHHGAARHHAGGRQAVPIRHLRLDALQAWRERQAVPPKPA